MDAPCASDAAQPYNYLVERISAAEGDADAAAGGCRVHAQLVFYAWLRGFVKGVSGFQLFYKNIELIIKKNRSLVLS